MISDMRRLRRSNSSQTTRAKRTRIAAMLFSGAPSGSIRARRIVDRDARDPQRLGAGELRVAVAMKAPHEEVVDDLLHEVGRILHERHVGLDVADDPEPPSTSWQKPCVVAIVAASKRAIARASRAWRSRTSPPTRGEQRDHLVAVGGQRAGRTPSEPLLGVHEPLAHAVAQLAGRHPRERHEQDLVQRRALGDVARRQRGDRERLAGARARLEHGDAGRQRAA